MARPRLDDHATKIREYPVTIVAAGAGFGKTTILHAWAKRCADDADIAWLALDDGDARLRTFAAYLDAALRRALPALGTSVSTMLIEGASESLPLARALVNELYNATEDNERDVVVFLDDFHTVVNEESIRDVVGEMLRTLPPRVHLVIATRFPCDFSPLVKLRADRRVADFDHNDLRFRSDEIAALLADSGAAPPDPGTLEALLRRTDGWAMAVRLTTQTSTDVRDDDRPFGELTERSLFAYLAEEVLRAQPPEIRDALLVCSVLKHLDASSIAMVLGRDGEPVLEQFIARNLYLEPSGDRKYRFHNLFREFLLRTFEREDAERIRAVRVRYATMLTERGDDFAAATQFIQAGAFIAAADRLAPAMRAIKWGDDFERIAKVLESIPEDVKRARPDIVRMQALAKRRNQEIPAAIALFERAVEYAFEVGDAIVGCWSLIDLALLYDDARMSGYGTFDRSRACLERALANLPNVPARVSIERSAMSLLALTSIGSYDFDRAHYYMDRVVQSERDAGSNFTDSLNAAAFIYGLEGKWELSLATAELSEELVRETGIFLGRAMRLQAEARCYLRDDMPRALAIAQSAIETERAHNQFDNIAESYIVLAQTHLGQDVPNVDRAHAALDEAHRRLMRRPNHVLSFKVHLIRAQAWIAAGNYAAAEGEIAAGRQRLLRYPNPHHAADSIFVEGLMAATAGDLPLALERFEAARAAFEPTRDAFHTSLADLAACGTRARLGSLDAKMLRALLVRIERDGQRAVALSAPRSASAALAWALRNAIETERATALLDQRTVGEADDIAALAADATASADARVAAVGILARRGERHRDLFARLVRDGSQMVAAAASTALGLMPSTATAQLSLWVVGRMRVQIGHDIIDERDARWSRRKAVEMLRALVLAEAPVPKAVVLKALWPESAPTAAETSLRVTLHALRRALQPEVDGAGDYIEYDGSTLALRLQAVAFVDAREALGAYRRAALARSRGKVEEARTLLLRAVDLLAASPAGDDLPAWLAPHAHAWRETLMASLCALAELERAGGSLAAARAYAERALALDALEERAVLEALEVALLDDDLDRARNLFVSYKQRLAAELRTTPGAPLLERYGRVLEARAATRSAELTPRDVQILQLVSQGKSSKQIAGDLGVSTFSVNAQVSRILRKLNVDSRAAAVAAASGLLEA